MKYVLYLRVSTKDQVNGIPAQQRTVSNFLATHGGEVIATFREVESGGKLERAELARAIQHCRETGATLLVSTLDRAARRILQIAEILDASSDINLRVADAPHASKTELLMRAVFAEQELDRIRQRTKDALAVLKEKGTKLGGAREGAWEARRANNPNEWSRNYSPGTLLRVRVWTRQRVSRAEIARRLTARGVTTKHGKPVSGMTVTRLVQRMGVPA